jgi:integrase
MKTMIKQMEEKEFTPQTIKVYMERLYLLNGHKKWTSMVFLRDTETMLNLLKEKYALSSQKSYLGTIISVLNLKPIKSNKKASDIYLKYLTDDIMPSYNKSLGEKTEKQKENWITREEIEALKEEYSEKANEVIKGRIGRKQYDILLENMILSMFVNLPPRRAKDYVLMKLDDDETEQDPKYNYYDGTEFTFNEYKTKKTNGQEKVQVPKVVKNDIAMYLDKTESLDKEFLITTYNGKPFSIINEMTRRLNKIFGGRKISVDMLRNMYYSHKYGDIKADIIQDAKHMGTSLNNAVNIYTKVE